MANPICGIKLKSPSIKFFFSRNFFSFFQAQIQENKIKFDITKLKRKKRKKKKTTYLALFPIMRILRNWYRGDFLKKIHRLFIDFA